MSETSGALIFILRDDEVELQGVGEFDLQHLIEAKNNMVEMVDHFIESSLREVNNEDH